MLNMGVATLGPIFDRKEKHKIGFVFYMTIGRLAVHEIELDRL